MDKRTRKMFASVFANKKSKHLNQYLKKEQKLSLYFRRAFRKLYVLIKLISVVN